MFNNLNQKFEHNTTGVSKMLIKDNEIELMQSKVVDNKIVECFSLVNSKHYTSDYMIISAEGKQALNKHYAYFTDLDCMFYFYDSIGV